MKNTIETAKLHLDANGFSVSYNELNGHNWTALVIHRTAGEGTLRVWSTDLEAELIIARADRYGHPTGLNQVTLYNPTDELIWHTLELMLAHA